jgi:hypothetical protein
MLHSLDLNDGGADGPTPDDLAAIDREWPLIDAELDVLDAEITNRYAADRGRPSPMDWRRLRRAEARVTRVAAELLARSCRATWLDKAAMSPCRMTSLTEVAMSSCRYGCKVMRCADCGGDRVVHNATYGCQTATDNPAPGQAVA